MKQHEIYFWLNCPSIHQAPLIKELTKRKGIKVSVIYENELSDERLKMGWPEPDIGECKCFTKPSLFERASIIANAKSESVHIFSGIKSYHKTFETFKIATRRKDLLICNMVESGRSDQGIKSLLRFINHSIWALKWRKSIDLLLATGSIAEKWWNKAGFKKEQIIEWGYFTDFETQAADRLTNSKNYVPYQIISVGSLIERKNQELLLNAVRELEDFKLTFVGDGYNKSKLVSMVKKIKIRDKVQFIGNIDNEIVQEKIRRSDLLVLTSRFDGWGAVVNESLSVGTPVICSDSCGSSAIINKNLVGDVFKSNDVSDLRSKIRNRMISGKTSKLSRNKLIKWAENSISPKVAADYLLKVIHEKSKINPPWKES